MERWHRLAAGWAGKSRAKRKNTGHDKARHYVSIKIKAQVQNRKNNPAGCVSMRHVSDIVSGRIHGGFPSRNRTGRRPGPLGYPGGDPVAAGQTAEMMAHAVPVEAEQGRRTIRFWAAVSGPQWVRASGTSPSTGGCGARRKPVVRKWSRTLFHRVEPGAPVPTAENACAAG